MERKCEICHSNNKKIIHTQKFILPRFKDTFKYDVSVCKSCGFVFADNIPSQDEYNEFYKNSNKYVYNENIPDGLKQIYNDIFSAAKQILIENLGNLNKSRVKIIDIGCSTGYLLNMFKRDGYKLVSGVEPSLSCCKIAEEVYGINIYPGTMAEFKTDVKYDFVISTGVLEHVYSLNNLISTMASLLSDEGMLLILVPDLGNFSKNPRVPFDEFSFELINYFTVNSLSNLMSINGLKNVYSSSIDAEFYDTKALVSIYKRTKDPVEIKKDNEGLLRLKEYVAASKNNKNNIGYIESKIESLVRSGEEVIVWGVGSLMFRLLSTTDLMKCNIKAFVDSNKSMHGQKINNVEIVSPDIFEKIGNNCSVFISSYNYCKEIKITLKERYDFKGNIVTVT